MMLTDDDDDDGGGNDGDDDLTLTIIMHSNGRGRWCGRVVQTGKRSGDVLPKSSGLVQVCQGNHNIHRKEEQYVLVFCRYKNSSA